MLRLVPSRKADRKPADQTEADRRHAIPVQHNTPDPAHHALTCRNLHYSINNRMLINDVSLSLSRTEITVVLGFNGAGKSLLLRLLHGMIKPTEGEVLWNGRPCNLTIRRKQAMVFQKPVLLRRTVIDNVRFVLRNYGIHDKNRAPELLQHVGLDHLAQRPARRLSGGEQQRLALGRALANEPDVLFLDEATASLDPASVKAIEDIVFDARQRGTKIILVTHDIGQARRMAGEIVFMSDGKVAELTAAAQFFDKPDSNDALAYLEGRLPQQTTSPTPTTYN